MRQINKTFLIDPQLALLPSPVSMASRPLLPITPIVNHILVETQKELGECAGSADQKINSQDVKKIISSVTTRLAFEITEAEIDQILERIEVDARPFGVLQPLVDCTDISDIIVTDYATVTIQQGRTNFKSDIQFDTPEAYEAFVDRLLQKAGTTYSNRKPIADGMIGRDARIHVVHSSLCETGPYLTIRINRFSSVTLDKLRDFGLAPQEVLTYLKAIVQFGGTLLIAGEVGTGKTTLARALASGISEKEGILVIEDTPEIILEHSHVRYLRTREANVDDAGRVSPGQLIRGGMRMAMNRIVFGEIRDAEAAEAFVDVCASGHPGLSTIHARSAKDAIQRLVLFLGRIQRGTDKVVLLEQAATAVQVVVHVDVCKRTGRRRIMEVREVGPVADGVLRQREIFRYTPEQSKAMWTLVHVASAHKEELENQEPPVLLSEISRNLMLAEYEAIKLEE